MGQSNTTTENNTERIKEIINNKYFEERQMLNLGMLDADSDMH